MSPRQFARWSLVLTVVATAVLVFAVAMLLRPVETQLLFNIVAFGAVDYPAEIPATAQPYIVFVYRVLGATMIGWMVAILTIIRVPFRRGDAWAWWAITLSIGGWFTIDSTASLLSGFPGNALLNLGFGLAFAVPLVATRSKARTQP